MPSLSQSIKTSLRISQSSSATGRTRKSTLREAVRSEGFGFSTELKEHTGCVNAIALSNGEGRWLASGGDDLEVLLWDLHSDLSPPVPAQALPSAKFMGHQSNIFGLAFSSTNAHLHSSGLDGLVHRYDLSRLGSSAAPRASSDDPERTVHVNDSAIRGLSSHPEDPNLILVAREDHRVYLHDFRLASTVVYKLAGADPWSGVAWSPVGGNLFAGCDEGGSLRLFDIRKSFQGTSSAQHTRVSAQAFRNNVVDYVTPKAIFSDLAGVSFSPNGNLLATNVLGYCPLVYSVGEAKPLAVLSSPPKQYRNRVTVKHGSFGPIGKNGECTYVTGSDDYYGYGWTIPTAEVLEQQQVEQVGMMVEGEEDRLDHKPIWAMQPHVPEGFSPTDLNRPSIRVGGHASIVNSALLHPYLPLLITSGVSSHVHLHSPFPFASSYTQRPSPSNHHTSPVYIYLPSETPFPTPPSRIPGGPYILAWQQAHPHDWETLVAFDRLVAEDAAGDDDFVYESEEEIPTDEESDAGLYEVRTSSVAGEGDEEEGEGDENWLGPYYRRRLARDRGEEEEGSGVEGGGNTREGEFGGGEEVEEGS